MARLGPGDPSTPPPAGTSTGAIGSYFNQYGLPLGTGGPAPQPADQPTIYLGGGKDKRYVSMPGPGSGGKVYNFSIDPGKPEKIATFNSQMLEFEKKSNEDKRRLAFLLALGGYAGSVKASDASEWAKQASVQDVREAYGSLLTDAENHYLAGQKLTPNKLLAQGIAYRVPGWNGKLDSLDAALAKSGIGGIGAAEESKARTWTETRRSVDFMDPADAKALARGVLQQELGRDPTQAEYEDFISAIHAAEKRNPATSRTTYRTNEDGQMVHTNTVSHQGIGGEGLAQLAIEKAQRNPNWAEWQAVATYAPALFQALGSAVPGA